VLLDPSNKPPRKRADALPCIAIVGPRWSTRRIAGARRAVGTVLGESGAHGRSPAQCWAMMNRAVSWPNGSARLLDPGNTTTLWRRGSIGGAADEPAPVGR
jgi:hypothetical protein